MPPRRRRSRGRSSGNRSTEAGKPSALAYSMYCARHTPLLKSDGVRALISVLPSRGIHCGCFGDHIVVSSRDRRTCTTILILASILVLVCITPPNTLTLVLHTVVGLRFFLSPVPCRSFVFCSLFALYFLCTYLEKRCAVFGTPDQTRLHARLQEKHAPGGVKIIRQLQRQYRYTPISRSPAPAPSFSNPKAHVAEAAAAFHVRL